MADITLALTTKGQVLKAKIEAGDGKIPLELTRIVTGAGSDTAPLELETVVDERQEFVITSRKTVGSRTSIMASLTNFGNVAEGIPPLAEGYPIAQIGFYALDPDEGEILYRISQFENPNWVPAATDRGWTYQPTFNLVTDNASEVIVEIKSSFVLESDFTETITDIRETILKFLDNLPDFDPNTRIITFTRHDGATLVVDLSLAAFPVDFGYDPETKELIFIKSDNTEVRVDISAIVPILKGSIGDHIQTEVDGTTIKASLINGSIGWEKLSTALQSIINGKEPAITSGSPSQYWSGDKTWKSFPTSLLPSGVAGGDLSGTYPNPNLAPVSRSNTTSSLSPGSAGTFTVIDSLTSDTKGRVTGVNTKTVTMPTSPSSATTAPGALTSGGTGEQGTSTNYARQDHTHTLPVYPTVPVFGGAPAALTSGGSGSAGTANTVSRSDHKHTMPEFPTGFINTDTSKVGAIWTYNGNGNPYLPSGTWAVVVLRAPGYQTMDGLQSNSTNVFTMNGQSGIGIVSGSPRLGGTQDKAVFAIRIA